jgi:site-specific recombinase XerD
MKEELSQRILEEMDSLLSVEQLDLLKYALQSILAEYIIEKKMTDCEQELKDKLLLLNAFLSAKKVEGCSEKTLDYYRATLQRMLVAIDKAIPQISTNDVRQYLSDFKEQRGSSKVTIDNIRRIFSSFFSWLEDEDYIVKNPVRRIHRVRADSLVKEIISDEAMETLRDSCTEMRDLAMIDMLASTGMRVGELVRINIADIDFQERQCVVFGKGNKERTVYFNARTKIHLSNYIFSRKDNNPALFVSLSEPYNRLSISGVEKRLRFIGDQVNIANVHPHKFRRTLATTAIDRGMPIEQVQKLLGHVKIDTTLHYAMVGQNNVKNSHRKFIC